MLDKLLGNVVGAALGRKGEGYSRKWLVVAAFATLAYLKPGFVPPDWLIQLVSIWIGAQGAADVASVFKKPAA